MKIRLVAACLAMALAPAAALALDSVRTASGTINGKITAVTPVKVVVEATAGAKEVPVNEIVTVSYDGEPAAIKRVRAAVLAEKWEDAAAALEGLKLPEDATPPLVADGEYYRALVAARMAMAGQGTIADAGGLMIGFVTKNPTSYHYLEANEVIGDLLVANRAFDKAEKYYLELSKAPWPDYQMRAKIAVARALMAQGKMAEAAQKYEEVLAMKADGERAAAFHAEATIGKYRSMLGSGKSAEVAKAAEEIIAKTEGEDATVLGPAYNLLGLALKKEGKNKEALLAFLHVDVLYSAAADAHAEALANLAELFNGLGQTDRAVRARRTLEERYPASPWAPKS